MVRIRPPRPGDGAGIAIAWCDFADFYCEMAPELYRAPRRAGLAAWLETRMLRADEDRLARVAEVDGAAIGLVDARFDGPVEHAEYQPVREVGLPRVFVGVLVVQRAHWRGGAGGALMGAVERWARERGARRIALDTFADSPVSVPFYERRLGYRREGIIFAKSLDEPTNP